MVQSQLNILFFFLMTVAYLSCICLSISSCFFFASSTFYVCSSFSFAARSLLRLISSRRSRFFYFSSSLSWLKPPSAGSDTEDALVIMETSSDFLDSSSTLPAGYWTGFLATGFLTSSSSLSDDSCFFFFCWGAPFFIYTPFLGAGSSSELLSWALATVALWFLPRP